MQGRLRQPLDHLEPSTRFSLVVRAVRYEQLAREHVGLELFDLDLAALVERRQPVELQPGQEALVVKALFAVVDRAARVVDLDIVVKAVAGTRLAALGPARLVLAVAAIEVVVGLRDPRRAVVEPAPPLFFVGDRFVLAGVHRSDLHLEPAFVLVAEPQVVVVVGQVVLVGRQTVFERRQVRHQLVVFNRTRLHHVGRNLALSHSRCQREDAPL